MKNRYFILLISLMLILPSASYGQLGKLIKNAASKAVNTVTKESVKEANKEIDSSAQVKTDKMVKENIGDSQNQKNQQGETGGQPNQGGMNIGKLFGNKIDLKYNEDYSFTSRLFMQSETYDKKDVLKMDMYMYFSANTPDVGIETKSFTDTEGNTAPVASSIVMDAENKCFIVLTDVNGMKMGIISAVPDENSVQAQPDAKAVKSIPANFTKTGNTRVILGYRCDEYSYTAEDKSYGKVWFTKESNLKIDKRGWEKTGMGNYYGYQGFEGGILLASESYDAKGTLVSKTETKEINPNFAHSISVKGYTLRQMNLGQQKK